MMSKAKMSNSFTVSMISVSRTYTILFSRQKYKSSAWTSVNLASGLMAGVWVEILCRKISGLPPCACARTYCINSCCWLTSNRASNFSPICLPDSDMSRTANFPIQTTSLHIWPLYTALLKRENLYPFRNIGWECQNEVLCSIKPIQYSRKSVAIRYCFMNALISLLCFFFQLLKWQVADCVFYLVGVLLCCFLIDTSSD